jgi:hypothetical protein
LTFFEKLRVKDESCNRVMSGIWHAFERGVDLDELRVKGGIEMS